MTMCLFGNAHDERIVARYGLERDLQKLSWAELVWVTNKFVMQNTTKIIIGQVHLLLSSSAVEQDIRRRRLF